MKKIYLFSTTIILLFSMLFCLSSCSIPQLKKTYNVVFEIDGQTYHTQTVTEGDCAFEPIEPKKSGYDFVGWYNNSRIWNFNFDKVNSNIILEAKWQINFMYMFRSWDNTLGVDIGSDGSYLELDTNPYDYENSSIYDIFEKIEAANEKLGFSSSLFQRMLSTRAIDGRMTESNEYVSISWHYHPDKGLYVLYEINE